MGREIAMTEEQIDYFTRARLPNADSYPHGKCMITLLDPSSMVVQPFRISPNKDDRVKIHDFEFYKIRIGRNPKNNEPVYGWEYSKSKPEMKTMEKLEFVNLNVLRIDYNTNRLPEYLKLGMTTSLTEIMKDGTEAQISISLTGNNPRGFIDVEGLKARKKKLKITIEEVDE